MGGTERNTGLQTLLVHPDHDAGRPSPPGAVAPILDRSSTFRLDAAAEQALASGRDADRLDVYGRYGTQTTRAASKLVARLEQAEMALLFASGTAAVVTLLSEMLPAGSVLAAASDLYGGTEVFLREELAQHGVQIHRFDPLNLSELQSLLERSSERPDLVWCESISNPLLKVAPLSRIAGLCSRHGVPLAVDNTFGAGIAIKPLQSGATVVVHSATKYLNGHSDVVAGAACGSEALVRRLWTKMTHLGGCIDPMGAWLLARGIRTLPLRWQRQCETAQTLATALQGHGRIERVHYPGLPEHPSHQVARQELSDFGAMVSFELSGGAMAVGRFLEGLELCTHAPSLGGIETLVSSPARSSHARMPAEQRATLGIRDGLVRMSVGLEDPDDLWDDCRRALEHI